MQTPDTKAGRTTPRDCRNGRHFWPSDYTDGDTCECGGLYLFTVPSGPDEGPRVFGAGERVPEVCYTCGHGEDSHAMAGTLACLVVECSCRRFVFRK